MKPHLHSFEAPPQSIITAVVSTGPHMNALKHGLRSAAVLLPGDDADEFHEMRQGMFDLHKPRTPNEARCVEAMADHEWCMARCRQMRQIYHGKLRALHNGDPGGAEGVHCERDPHRWHHSALDCSLEEGRLGRSQNREFRKLAEMQKLRRQNLIAGAVEIAEREEAMGPLETGTQPGKAALPGTALPGASGKPSASARPTGPGQGEEVAVLGTEAPTMASDDGGNRKNRERTEEVERSGRFSESPAAARPNATPPPPNFPWREAGQAGYTMVSSARPHGDVRTGPTARY